MKIIQKFCAGGLFVLLVVLVSSISAHAMKIAVPSIASEKDALISEETGRAPFFLLFDDKGHFIKAISNPAISQSGGISRTVVALLVEMDVSMVVASSVGDKMKAALTKKKIDIILKTGSADAAVNEVLKK